MTTQTVTDSDNRLQSVAFDAGFYELPEDIQQGLKYLLVGAIELLKKHSVAPSPPFDWSRVTEKQLREVPQSVVGELQIDCYSRLTRHGVAVALFTSVGWLLFDCHELEARVVLACIDRIAEYLRTRSEANEST